MSIKQENEKDKETRVDESSRLDTARATASSNKLTHTPLPWQGMRQAEGHVVSADGRLVAGCMGYTTNFDATHTEVNIANAEFIVRACNNHYELLAALKELADAGSGLEDDIDEDAIALARAAIAKAEE